MATERARDEPLPLGTAVPPYGEIQAVGMLGGERYYWLTTKDGAVSMIPAVVLEPMHAEAPDHAE